MTAEIIIMNKSAIALAADSAVTIGSEGKKTYNTVNKLFALSKYHPVGIMLYDNAEFMGVPWETIIKLFRAHLDRTGYDSLREYYDKFIDFIESENIIFSDHEQEKYFGHLISFHFFTIQQAIDKKIKEFTDCNGNITYKQVKVVIDEEIKKRLAHVEQLDALPNFDEECADDIILKYTDVFLEVRDDIFESLPLSKSNKEDLYKISTNVIAKKMISISKSGIVIAGFGNNEVFPSAISFTAECLLNNKLKHYNISEYKGSTAEIIPFAQKEMPYRFMEGVDPVYQNLIEKSLYGIFETYPDVIVSRMECGSEDERNELVNKLKEHSVGFLKEYIEKLEEYRFNNFVRPVVNAVAVLPKDELAAMAESLVHITSLKRKFSLEQETVAGPIDVAIISKGDGFVWIKRKHYFKAELNPMFINNYFAYGGVKDGDCKE